MYSLNSPGVPAAIYGLSYQTLLNHTFQLNGGGIPRVKDTAEVIDRSRELIDRGCILWTPFVPYSM